MRPPIPINGAYMEHSWRATASCHALLQLSLVTGAKWETTISEHTGARPCLKVFKG